MRRKSLGVARAFQLFRRIDLLDHEVAGVGVAESQVALERATAPGIFEYLCARELFERGQVKLTAVPFIDANVLDALPAQLQEGFVVDGP